MKYLDIFKEFWDKRIKYKSIKNKQRMLNSFITLYEQVCSEYDISDIVEKYIVDNKASIMKEIQLEFYDYLTKYYNTTIETNLENLLLPNIERQLKILKSSQGTFDVNELANEYKVDDTTIRKDLNELENGIVFMDTMIKPEIREFNRREADKYYVSTVHPIFLPLNLTEVYALMKYLPQKLDEISVPEEEKRNIKMINGLIERMQLQLSDYALNNLKIDIDKSNKSLRFVPEEEIITDEAQLMHLMKRMINDTEITINSVNKYYGRIGHNDDGYIIRTIDGEEIPFDLNTDTLAFKDYE